MDEARINSILEQWSRAVEDNGALLASGYAPRTSMEELIDKYTKQEEPGEKKGRRRENGDNSGFACVSSGLVCV